MSPSADELAFFEKTNFEISGNAQPEIFTFYGNIKNDDAGVSGTEILINVVGGNVPYTYEWSNGRTTKDLYCISAGDYVLTVTDSTGRQICNLFHVDKQ